MLTVCQALKTGSQKKIDLALKELLFQWRMTTHKTEDLKKLRDLQGKASNGSMEAKSRELEI